MKVRWQFGIMVALLAAIITGTRADDTDQPTGDVDGSQQLAEHFSAFAHQTLRQTPLPQRALAMDAALYRAAMKLNDSEPRFSRALADVLMEMNDVKGAMAALKRYRELEPDDQTAQVQYIDLYLASDDVQSLDQRLAYLRHLLQVQGIPDPVKSEVAYRAAELRMQKGQQEEAMKLLDIARQLNPLNLRAARTHYIMTQDKALPVDRVTQLLGILQANPADPVVCSRLAEQLAELGLVDAAMMWYGQANALFAATGARADPAFVLGASSQLLIAKKPEPAAALAERYNQAVPEDADGWFVSLSIIKFQLAQYAQDQQTQDRMSATLKKAGIAISNRLMRIRYLTGDKSATTRPVDSADDTVLPDLSGDAARFQDQRLHDLVAPYAATLSSLAWLDLYYKHDSVAATPLIDDLERITSKQNPIARRLRAWQQYIAGDSKGALKTLRDLQDSDPLAGLGVVLIQKDNPSDKTRALVVAQRLINEHPSGVIGAVLWAEFSRLGIKIEPAPSSSAVATLVANVPDAFMQLINDPKGFYDVQVTPLKPTYEYGEPILVRVTLQNVSNVDLAIGDDCAVHPELLFDARFRGMIDEKVNGVPGAAVGRLDQRLVLAPGYAVSTVVRIDQDALFSFLSGSPALDVLLDLTLVLNPIGTVLNQAARTAQDQPGICGYSVPSSELIARQPTPIGKEDQRAALYERLASEDGGVKIRAIQALGAYIHLLAGSKDPSAGKIQTEFITRLHRVDPQGKDPVAAFQQFQIAALADGDDQVKQIQAMSTDSRWESRMLALVACNNLSSKGIEIASQLTGDSDPVVKDYAVALTASMQAAAATRPSSSSPPPQTSQTP